MKWVNCFKVFLEIDILLTIRFLENEKRNWWTNETESWIFHHSVMTNWICTWNWFPCWNGHCRNGLMEISFIELIAVVMSHILIDLTHERIFLEIWFDACFESTLTWVFLDLNRWISGNAWSSIVCLQFFTSEPMEKLILCIWIFCLSFFSFD